MVEVYVKGKANFSSFTDMIVRQYTYICTYTVTYTKWHSYLCYIVYLRPSTRYIVYNTTIVFIRVSKYKSN